MLDNIKIEIYDQDIISRLITHQEFIQGKPLNNNYHTLIHKEIGAKLSLNLRKAFENKILIGYRHIELIISPHYHYNSYAHNGNDFSPLNCINTITDILNYLGIANNKYEEFKVTNLEFGLNLVPSTDIENLVNGISYYKTKDFLVEDFPHNKITDATKYKLIKAYAKGLQFIDNPEYSINPNTFRFEIKTKQSKYLKTLCIKSISDLLNIDTYKRLGQALLDDWEHIFLLNLKPDYKHLNSNEAQYVKQCNKPQYWQQYQNEMHRNSVRKNKEKYSEILTGKNDLHLQIKRLIIDKLVSFNECANSTQRKPISKGKNNFKKLCQNKINLEFAHQVICNVTGLDISMQKKGSKYLCISGLKSYYKNNPNIYSEIAKKYLTKKMKSRDFESQLYFIAHNIRNTNTNKIHNPKYNRIKFEQRHYPPNQLQFNF